MIVVGSLTPSSTERNFFKSAMTLIQAEDSELIHLWQAGNQQALSILYDRYGALVYRLALRILGNASEAEDLTQEIFTNLCRQFKFNDQRGSLTSYLLIMTRSRAIDQIRKGRSRQQLVQKFGRLSNTEQAQPMDRITTQELSQRVRSALQQLPDKHRQVLELAYYNGMSQSEISASLAIPLGTVKSWSRSGLLKLRKLLADLGD